MIVRAEHYVFGLEVAVDYAALVRGVENVCDGFEHFERLLRREATALLQLAVERVPLDVLHDHVDHAVAASREVVDGDGVRVSERARGLALALEALEPLRVVAHLGAKGFDDDLIAQEYVARAVDRAHAALRDEALDLVLAVNDFADD